MHYDWTYVRAWRKHLLKIGLYAAGAILAVLCPVFFIPRFDLTPFVNLMR